MRVFVCPFGKTSNKNYEPVGLYLAITRFNFLGRKIDGVVGQRMTIDSYGVQCDFLAKIPKLSDKVSDTLSLIG